MNENAPLFRHFRKPEFPLFDCHVHIGASDTGELFYPELTIGEYTELMQAGGIARANIFAPLRADGYRDANRELASSVDNSHGKLRAFARIGGRNKPMTELQPWMAKRKLSSLLSQRPSDVDLDALADFSGVKLLPHMDGMPGRATLARIDELALPIVIHGGRYSTPRWIERTIARHVRSPVIIAHLGAFPCEEHLLHESVAVARRNDHVYFDTSGAWHADYIRYMARRLPEKLVFGSDAPLMHPFAAWTHISTAIKSDTLLERIGWHTPTTLFRI